MTIVSNSSAFPKTVQPGIPNLADCPKGWLRAPLRKFLHEERRPIKMEDDKEYRLVTVKRARGGVVERERLRGRDIAVKSQFLVHTGDFLISKRQIVHGACGLVPAELDGSIVSNEYAVLRGNSKIDLEFLNCLAHSIYFQQTCFHSSIGVHIEKMIFKLSRWLGWQFDLPPLSEQVRIAAILATWDRAIDVVETMVENSQLQKRGVMQQLLTEKKRLAGFKGEWKSVAIAQMGMVIAGGTPESGIEKYWNGDVPWATPTDITGLDGRYIHDTARKISREGLAQSAAKLLPIGTILVCTRATIGELAIAATPISTNQGFKSIVPNKNHDSEFLFYLLQFNQHELIKYACGSTFVEISKRDFEKRSFQVPKLDEQQAIAAILANCDDQITALTRQALVLKSEKLALMQELLTGKRRVQSRERAA